MIVATRVLFSLLQVLYQATWIHLIFDEDASALSIGVGQSRDLRNLGLKYKEYWYVEDARLLSW